MSRIANATEADHEMEITPEMIVAGVEAMAAHHSYLCDDECRVEAAYLAMEKVRRTTCRSGCSYTDDEAACRSTSTTS